MSWLPDAIAVAAIAGVVSFVGLVITKQSKVSEFRQQWIDALREDVSSFITQALDIHAGKKSADAIQTAISTAHEVQCRIRLRLNPDEHDSNAITSAIKNLGESATGSLKPEYEQMAAEADDVVKKTQVVLKQEWNRVKTGERFYMYTFRSVITGSVVFAASLACLFFYQQYQTSNGYLVMERRSGEGDCTVTMKHKGNTLTARCITGCDFIEVGRTYKFKSQGSNVVLWLANPNVRVFVMDEKRAD